jgi:alpha-galactosidase
MEEYSLMKENIVLIGAGSAMFTRGLIADLIRTGWEIDLGLVDIDAEALAVAEGLAQKMIAAKNASITLRASIDRAEILRGATVVICTIGVGKRPAWEQDVFIPRKYGIYMPVGDTVGPGGSSRAMRMIPAMVEIAEDVLELAPQALFFNYGNPMSPVCRGIRKATGANVVGLCHGVNNTAHLVASELGVPAADLRYTAAGINHLTWFTEMRANGIDLMQKLRQIAANKVRAARNSPLAAGTRQEDPFGQFEQNLFSWQLLDRFGAFPAPLDRHVTEFFPQFYREGHYFGRTLGVDAFSFEGTIAAGDQIYAQMSADAQSPEPLPDDTFNQFSGEHEQVVDIIAAIRSDSGAVFSANLPNAGQIPNLPLSAVVESPAIATANGLRPIILPPLPACLAGTLSTRFLWVETLVDAALEGSRDKFIQALVLDGAVSSMDQVAQLADELLGAQTEYLPWY